MHHHLRVAFNQDVQLRVFAWAGFFASGVEGALGGDGRAGGFEDLGDIRPVRDSPPCFFYINTLLASARLHGEPKMEGRPYGESR